MLKRFTIQSGGRTAEAGSSIPTSPDATATSVSWAETHERDAEVVAARAIAHWQSIIAALTPVIGQHGMTALYRRTMSLCATTHTWLPPTHDDTSMAMQLTSLRNVLGQRSVADATDASHAMLTTITALLVSLIGETLTQQLLQPATRFAPSVTNAPSSFPVITR
jgi:hypothetical protein